MGPMEETLNLLLNETPKSLLNYLDTMIGIGVAGILGVLIGFHFITFGQTFSGRSSLARI